MAEPIVLHRAFYSHALRAEKRYSICLPNSYRSHPELRYSTLYLLPGLMDYERTWVDRGRVHEAMSNLQDAGRLGELIVVMPDKDAAATDEDGEQAFTHYLGNEVIGHIDASYRTIPSRSHRGLEGLSLGAGWTWRMILARPDLFCSFGMLSGGFGEEAPEEFRHVREYLHRVGARFRIGVGLQEPEYMENNQEMVQFLRSQGFYCEFDVADGPHDWPLWQKQVINSLQFHYYSFNGQR